MKKLILNLLICFTLGLNLAARDSKPMAPAELVVHEIRYDGHLADEEARFTLVLDATASGPSVLPLLSGDVAIMPAKLPVGLNLIREGNNYQLQATRAGKYKFQLELLARITRTDPWNQISFTGPPATIAALSAQTTGTNTEVQLLNGTQLENAQSNGVSHVIGFLGADQTVALRWQGKVAEIARNALLTVDSDIHARITASLIKYTSKFHYHIVQGNVSRLTLILPAAQSLTRLEGEQIRDWHTAIEGDHQSLVVEFIKPLEDSYDLTLFSEQAPAASRPQAALAPPQPQAVERESGAITVFAEDIQLEVADLIGLRQVNAADQDFAAYQFNARPFTLSLAVKQLEPVIGATDQVNARLEETRLLASHHLTVTIEKAGVYRLELLPPPGFNVTDVKGDNLDDWKMVTGKLQVNFASRLLGSYTLDVEMEQSQKTFPDRIDLGAVRVVTASRESAQIGVAAAPGIRMKTGALSGLREIPVSDLASHVDEILAYAAEQPDWKLTIGAERLPARIVADVFNLVTIGNGIVGGSATIRYSLANQGVQEFNVRLPAQYRNVEFTGPNIRRKEIVAAGTTNRDEVIWKIGLQDKAWDGYTLVVTYDYPFNPDGSALALAGVHAAEADRETGSVAVTTAASLQINPHPLAGDLHRIDESELSATDHSLITRAVVLAYQYSGPQYELGVDVKRYAEEPVLAAVADRTQITSVLTEAGEMLTQASFMVKNNEKQFQRFELPADAKLWGCYVDGQPIKPERDHDWVMVSLPRDLNRDAAFAVDILYAQTNSLLAGSWSKTLALQAPRTDVPNTYAEWQIYAPPTLRLSDFGGSMKVTQGTTYELLDAWERFLTFYGQVLREAGGAILFIGLLAFLVIALVISAVRRGWNGVITILAVTAALAVLGAMLLPALASAKRKAQRISSVNNLKEIGLATHIFAGDNTNRLPASFEEMRDELGTDKITYDTETGQRYAYLGSGLSFDTLKPDSVIAYSPIFKDHCNVLFADGSVAQLSASAFGELSQRGLVQTMAEKEPAAAAAGRTDAAYEFMGSVPVPAATPAAAGSYGANGEGRDVTAGTSTYGGKVESATSPGVNNSAWSPTTAPAVAPGTPDLQSDLPAVAGIRSLRIELPETGQPFLFTKVLNVRDEPLSIRASVTTLHAFKAAQMAWQSVLFVLGVVVWWWQWRRLHRNTFILTLALALMVGAVGSLLIEWRALHDALIIAFPVVALAAAAFLVWRYWPRDRRGSAPAELPVSPAGPATPPAIAAVALLATLWCGSAFATTTASLPAMAAHILSASYTGTISDRVALIDATFQFTAATAGGSFNLFSSDVAVQQFSAKNGAAELMRSGDYLAIKFNHSGEVCAEIKLLVKVTGDVTKRNLAFETPPALAAQVSLLLDQTEADIDFPAAISFQQNLEKDKTRVDAVLGVGNQVELSWTPRVKRATEIAATVFCHNATAINLGNGVVNARATMDYQITQGELRQARVLIPAGQHLLRVEAPGIRTWDLKNENGAAILVVDLTKGISPDWQLIVETEAGLPSLPASLSVQIPHALDVKREDGLVALRTAPDLALSIDTSTGLERVDAEEIRRVLGTDTNVFTSAFRFAATDFSLQTRVETVQPEIEAAMWNQFRVSPDQISLSAMVDFQIKRVGIFNLKVALPDGYQVIQVIGDNIAQRAEHIEDGQRLLEVTLKERISGRYPLKLELSRSYDELPKSFAATGIHPLGTVKLTGYVAVLAEPGVAVKTDGFDGLTEIPATALPDFSPAAPAGSVLAYQFISADPGLKQSWQLKVNLEAVAAWVRAEIVDSFTLSEPLITGHALIRFNIANAPVKELSVRIPARFQNPEITGQNIRSRDRDGEVWHIELQSPVSGFYLLDVTWDQPSAVGPIAVDLRGVSAEGIERETGFLTVSARAPLQLTETGAANVQKVDATEIPDWAASLDSAPTFVYRYVQPGYKVAMEARHFDEAEVLQALVDDARLTSVVADDGQMMTALSLSVRNNGLQFLEMELPENASVWSASVGGQAIRPSKRDGKLLLPIESTDTEKAVAVELTYVSTNAFPHTKGNLSFVSPKFDVPLKDARWELYLPSGYDYQNFSGTMSREITAANESFASSFSKLDYSRMEKASQTDSQVEMEREVTEARRQLVGGNVREATASFNRARVNNSLGQAANKDMLSLAEDLKKAQASNLINAQSYFSERNAEPADSVDRPQPSQVIANAYTDVAAGEQWAKLQQAQEVVAAKVQPLRVNLPLRGLHYTCTQVLQTEGGKPMTISLYAVSNQLVNWPARLLGAGVAFLFLWGLVISLSRVVSASRRINC